MLYFQTAPKAPDVELFFILFFLQFISYMEYGVQAQWKVTDEHAETNLHSS